MSIPITPDDIFAKIKSQYPDLVRLSSSELARLQAWLKRNPFQNTLSEFRRIANGDKATQDAVQIRKDWHSHLEATVQWNLAEYAKRQQRRRRTAAREPRPLTAKESEAVYIVGEHKGNITAAAKAIGVSRQALEKRYKTAHKKLGTKIMTKHKTKAMPIDNRGQENISEDRRR